MVYNSIIVRFDVRFLMSVNLSSVYYELGREARSRGSFEAAAVYVAAEELADGIVKGYSVGGPEALLETFKYFATSTFGVERTAWSKVLDVYESFPH